MDKLQLIILLFIYESIITTEIFPIIIGILTAQSFCIRISRSD